MRIILKAVLVLMTVLTIVGFGFNAFITGLDTWRITLVVMAMAFIGSAAVLLTAWLCVVLMKRILETRDTRYGAPASQDDPPARVRVPAGLPPAPRRNVPRVFASGAPAAISAPLILETKVGNQTYEVQSDVLEDFLRMDILTRRSWGHGNDAYTRCIQFCAAHNMILARGSGYAWAPHQYTQSARLAWLDSILPSPTGIY